MISNHPDTNNRKGLFCLRYNHNCDRFIDGQIIDGFLHLIARVFIWIGDFLKLLNTWLIDGVGDGIPEYVAKFGAWFRRVQTGRVQQYLLLVAIAALLIVLVFAVSSGLLVQASGG